MFKSFLFAAATVAVATAQQANLIDLLIFDELSHRGGYYYGGGHDLLPLLALGGLGGGFPSQAGGTIMLEEYLLWQDLMHGTHSHGGPHGMDEVLPLVLLGMSDAGGNQNTFDSMMAIHELQIASRYDDEWFGGHGLLSIASRQNPELNSFLHDFHVIQGVADHRYNGNSADLLPLAFLTSNDPYVQMENLHQFHYMQHWDHDNHSDLLALGLLGGNMFHEVQPIMPYWALDSLINDYGHHGSHHGSHHGHYSHGSHHGHGSHYGHGSRHYGSHHGYGHRRYHH